MHPTQRKRLGQNRNSQEAQRKLPLKQKHMKVITTRRKKPMQPTLSGNASAQKRNSQEAQRKGGRRRTEALNETPKILLYTLSVSPRNRGTFVFCHLPGKSLLPTLNPRGVPRVQESKRPTGGTLEKFIFFPSTLLTPQSRFGDKLLEN